MRSTRIASLRCRNGRSRKSSAESMSNRTHRRREYFRHLLQLQAELIKLQSWMQHTKAKVVVVFEGRDAAGKRGVVKRITQRLNPRICRVVALPTEREQTQWYFER